ncbi:hypothetical protein PanWU01x14_167650 [Parasponia andersonii]|uniref:Uncharacterized protein n=1 Tax=Parasponia andersonii TaxID=3476 RepID=A0A2P5CBD9_PARAD|nr:hypothetical protein PanWU01x14_167650 [Parasponia andersonii]
MRILCSHALKVLNARGIYEIPPRYILRKRQKSAQYRMGNDDYDHGEELTRKRKGGSRNLDLASEKVEDIWKTNKTRTKRALQQEQVHLMLVTAQILIMKFLGQSQR